MSRLDRYRLSMMWILAALGVVIIVRGAMVMSVSGLVLGGLLLALGLYRINQYRRFRAGQISAGQR